MSLISYFIVGLSSCSSLYPSCFRAVVEALEGFIVSTVQSVHILEPRYLYDNIIMAARIYALILFHSHISDVDLRQW